MMTCSPPFACDPPIWLRRVAASQAPAQPRDGLAGLGQCDVPPNRRSAARSDPDLEQRGLLRRLVADALTNARTWEQAQAGLHLRGLGYVAAAGAILVIDPETGEVLGSAGDLGPGSADLVRRFGPLPAPHSRPGLAALARAAIRPPCAAAREPPAKADTGHSLPMRPEAPCDPVCPNLG